MANAADRQQCGDAGVVHFANSVTTVIQSIDPLALVTIGMFTFHVCIFYPKTIFLYYFEKK